MKRPRWGLRIATALSLLLLATGGAGYFLLSSIGSGIHRVDAFGGISDRPREGHGLTFLVAGVDRRDSVSEEDRRKYRLGGEPCNCTDALMLVHLSKDRDRASVVSIPRDSYVELPPHTNRALGERRTAHAAKVNAAYTHGGPPLTVRAVEKLSGVHIDHYVEIDFAAFMKTVDVVGGVQVCTQRPLRDKYSGLDLPAGTSSLDGGEALAYVRARHLDGASDMGRMKRQQRFLAAVIDKLTGTSGLMNPLRFREVGSTLLGSVRTDAALDTGAVFSLGKALHGFSPGSSEFATVPVADMDYEVPGLGTTVRWDEERARRLFDRLREDRPLKARGGDPDGRKGKGKGQGKGQGRATPVEVPPEQVRVQVANGTGEDGLGGRVDRSLARTGFDTTGAPTTAARTDRTILTYDPEWDRSARSLAAALPHAKLVPDRGHGALMTVTLGDDHEKVHRVRPADPILDGADVWSAVTGDEVLCT
ncbi:LytR family transcriptional regulator [Streptomyces sp. WAC 06738]|uniref:LCP family protein n=1 Tax=Streptomyces sp. WAC 06738 TaxID=2203210 RepID=UPI000F6FFCAF|nr:LCP family protein [Streptomyces sp. WAC 06738]AZM46368.1 LytR family transcriptional regulator [Streptomyces sp. WAC 06738]